MLHWWTIYQCIFQVLFLNFSQAKQIFDNEFFLTISSTREDIYLMFLNEETVKFSIKGYFNKCEHICWKLSIGSRTL